MYLIWGRLVKTVRKTRHARIRQDRQDSTVSPTVQSPARQPTLVKSPRNQVIALQRTVGNRTTQRLLQNGEVATRAPRIQRSSWWDSITETAGDLLDTAGAAASSIWDAMTGGDKKSEPAKPKRPSTPDDSAEYEVTDKQALIRTPPPDLDSAPYVGMVIPKGTIVKIVEKHQKGSKWYVRVEVVRPFFALPSGWTSYSNLSTNGSIPEPEDPSDDDTKKSVSEELEEIAKIKPEAYVEQEEDADKRAKVIELANADKSKDDLLDELKEESLTIESWFADLYPSATFLGLPITGNRFAFKKKKLGGVHKELYERLKVAEKILADETGLAVAELADELGIEGVSGLREVEPATGKSEGVGLHSLGLAIDLDAKGGSNPYLRGKSVDPLKRATTLIKYGDSTKFEVKGEASRGTGKSSLEKRVTQADAWYDVMRDASKSLEVYLAFETKTEVTVGSKTLKLEELAKAYGAATGDSKSVADWQTQIAEDRKQLKGGDFGKGDPGKGFLNLDKRLVMALVKAGLTWGGTLGSPGKDLMHFDYRSGTIERRAASRTAM